MLGSSWLVYYWSMIRFAFTVVLLTTALSATGVEAQAQARELTRAELRENVQSGRSMSFAQLIDRTSALIEGDVVDVRAFDISGIYYKVLIKQANGRLVAIVLDAASGDAMPTRSPIAGQVMAAARSKNGHGADAQSVNSAVAGRKNANSGNASGQGDRENHNANRGGGPANNNAERGSDNRNASGSTNGGGGGGGSGGDKRGGGDGKGK